MPGTLAGKLNEPVGTFHVIVADVVGGEALRPRAERGHLGVEADLAHAADFWKSFANWLS